MTNETAKKYSKKPTVAELRHDKEKIEESIRICQGQLSYRMDCLKKGDRILQEAQEGVEKAQAKLDAVRDLIETGPQAIIGMKEGIRKLEKALYKNSVAPKVAKLAAIRMKIAELEADLTKE